METTRVTFTPVSEIPVTKGEVDEALRAFAETINNLPERKRDYADIGKVFDILIRARATSSYIVIDEVVTPDTNMPAYKQRVWNKVELSLAA